MRFQLQHAAMACLFLFITFISVGCDGAKSDESDDTSALVGTYDMKSIQNKIGTQFDLPGETLPTNKLVEFTLSDGVSDFIYGIYIEGVLTVSTQSYNLTTSVTFEIDRANPQNEVDTESGTYSVDGSTLTLVSSAADSDGPESFTLSIDGQILTLENADLLLIFTMR